MLRFLFNAPGPTYFRVVPATPRATGVPPVASTKLSVISAGQAITGNKGNQIHAEAPAKIFRKSDTSSVFSNLAHLHKQLGDGYSEFIRNRFDVVVVSLANYIRPKQNHESLFEAIRDLPPSVKIIALGAGIQDNFPAKKISQSTHDLSKILNDRCTVFGVRGEHTQAWLADQGVNNTVVLGCPSLYVYPLSIFRMDYSNIPEKPQIISAGHLSKSKLTREQTQRGREFAKIFEGIKADYVFQDEPFSYDPYVDEPGFYNEGTGELDAAKINAYLSDISGAQINFGKYYYFVEMGAWRQMCMRYDVYFGDRFHAGIAATQAGVPALIINNDQRVDELTRFFGMPTITSAEIVDLGIPRSITAKLNSDALLRFQTTYRSRLKKFCDVMEDAGLEVVQKEIFSPDF